MKSYEQLGCAMQAMLEAGFELSVDVHVASKVPEFPIHWAHSISGVIGKIRIINEDPKGFHLKFNGGDTDHAEDVVNILRRYLGEGKEPTDQPVLPIKDNRGSDPYALLKAMFPNGYFGY